MTRVLYRLWRIVRWVVGFAVFIPLVLANLLALLAIFRPHDARGLGGALLTFLAAHAPPG